MDPLTPEEKRAIAALKRLAKQWPKSLWLFSASGTLNVMRNGPDGKAVHYPFKECGGGGVHRDYKVDVIHGIDNDGGDW